MSLFPCPECGKQISSNARSCPGCGFTGIERAYKFHLDMVARDEQRRRQLYEDEMRKRKEREAKLASRTVLMGYPDRRWRDGGVHEVSERQYNSIIENAIQSILGKGPDTKIWEDYVAVEFTPFTIKYFSKCCFCSGRGFNYETWTSDSGNHYENNKKIRCDVCKGSGGNNVSVKIKGVNEHGHVIFCK